MRTTSGRLTRIWQEFTNEFSPFERGLIAAGLTVAALAFSQSVTVMAPPAQAFIKQFTAPHIPPQP